VGVWPDVPVNFFDRGATVWKANVTGTCGKRM
jgi:hypothetical protein